MPKPFHVYSMRQAIEERGLDVLKHTLHMRLTLNWEEGETQPLGAKATKAHYQICQPASPQYCQKTEKMIEHFRKITRHKIGGRAKVWW